MRCLRVTALVTTLAALASTSPIPDLPIVEGADDVKPEVYRRDLPVVEGADDVKPEVYRRDLPIVEGADDVKPEVYRKEKRGVYSKYENNGPYVPMSDETKV